MTTKDTTGDALTDNRIIFLSGQFNEEKAKDIITAMAGQERGPIKSKLSEAGIPDAMIKELLPVEGAAAEGAAPVEGEPAGEGEKAGEGAKPEAKPEEAPKGKEEKKK